MVNRISNQSPARDLGRAALNQKLEELHAQINELAMSLSTSSHPEINLIWNDLANARAYLASALQAVQTARNARFEDYQI